MKFVQAFISKWDKSYFKEGNYFKVRYKTSLSAFDINYHSSNGHLFTLKFPNSKTLLI